MPNDTRAHGRAVPVNIPGHESGDSAAAAVLEPPTTGVLPTGAEMLVAGVALEATLPPPAHAHTPPPAKVMFKLRVANVIAVTVPAIGVLAAMVLLWGTAFSWFYLALTVGMFIVTGLGITIGFHRLFTHRSFTSPAWLRYAIAAAGSMAIEGPVIEWCADHRKHHQCSDDEGDPHSPVIGPNGSWGEGFMATLRGAWHSHIGWILFQAAGKDRADERASLERYVKDLRADAVVAAADRHFGLWALVGLAIPAVIAGVVTGTWLGALLGFIWGGLVRVFLVHHVTWSVNSICHLWGSQDFRSYDESRNNPIVGVLALGEGWHNNHHAFPSSARHGLFWWQFDLSYILIRALGLVGLAKDIRVPEQDRIDAKRIGARRETGDAARETSQKSNT